MLQKNAILELEITDMDCEGLGISHVDGYTVFVHKYENACKMTVYFSVFRIDLQ